MAADYKQMLDNLRNFYDFSDKTVLAIGAGGGQFLDLGRGTRKLIAIDQDSEAVRQLQYKLASAGMQEQVEVVQSDFCDTSVYGDVAYFEFSLHEMSDPEKALRHACSLAPEVVVFDHLAESEWAYFAVEEDKVKRSTQALERFSCERHAEYETEQRFADHAQLLQKVSCQGPLALERARCFQGEKNIVIPMTYGLHLLKGDVRQ